MSEANQAQAPTYVPLDQGEMMGRLKSKIHEFRRERDAARVEVEEVKKEVGRLEKELANHPAVKRAKDIEAKLREIEHRKVFDRTAKAAGVREDGLDDLYNLSGYKPEGEVIDEAAVATLIEEQKAKRGYLFEPATPEKPAPKPGPASGQGRSAPGAIGFELPGENDPRWSDAIWQWNNRKEIAEAYSQQAKNGVV